MTDSLPATVPTPEHGSAPATAAPTATPDLSHTYPAAPTLDGLRHDVQTVYGQLLHAEHQAEDRHDGAAQGAYHHAATLLGIVMGIAA